ncbi:MAG: hypothetical protein IPP55_06980 [Anaerolineales bacterium]|nr:hypothetical protein [Anaerolineales bacterium]
MLKTKLQTLLTLTFIVAALITACGGSEEENQAIIQTSVAETVAAQAPSEAPVTETPAETLVPTKTPFAMPTLGSPIPLVSPTTGVTTGKVECAKASLQDETVVDGKIFKPGVQFTKTWYITNTSTCVWDTTYKIVFWSGDILGGGYVYQLPQVTGPGQTVPISLVLTAPATAGKFHSEWKLQTPDGINFGVGVYQAAFYTDIEVANLTTTTAIAYDIVDVILEIDREPDYGCAPANMVYTAVVTITTNGPLKFTYQIRQQDGNHDYKKTVTMKEAGEFIDTDHTWKLGRAASQHSKRWMQVVILEPVYREYAMVPFDFYCP